MNSTIFKTEQDFQNWKNSQTNSINSYENQFPKNFKEENDWRKSKGYSPMVKKEDFSFIDKEITKINPPNYPIKFSWKWQFNNKGEWKSTKINYSFNSIGE